MRIGRDEPTDSGSMSPEWDEPPKQSSRLRTRRVKCPHCPALVSNLRELESHDRMAHPRA